MQKTGANDTIADLASRYRGSINSIANDHSSARISRTWKFKSVGPRPSPGSSAGSSISRQAMGSSRMGRWSTNSGAPMPSLRDSLVPGSVIVVGELEHEVTESDTLQSVSAALDLDDLGEIVEAIAALPGYLNPGVRLLVPINLRLRQTAPPRPRETVRPWRIWRHSIRASKILMPR